MTERPDAIFVAGMAFGDEGKGSIVDYLTRKHSAEVVVRYNGGHQAAHNVVTSDGKHHTFSQFGSGHLAGAKTFLARHMIVEPHALTREARALHDLCGDNPYQRLVVDEDCLVTTVYHRLAGQIREKESGHGSCGVGVGATKADAAKWPLRALRMRHLRDEALVVKELTHICERLEIDDKGLPTPTTLARSLCLAAEPIQQVNHRYREHLLTHKTLIFEGAQGLLLDQESPFFPHVTYADTTFNHIDDDFPRAFRSARRIGVTRSYFTRHGAGPFPTELALAIDERHNAAHPWQGSMRFGTLDMPLLHYAQSRLHCTEIALTHFDQYPGMVCPLYLRERLASFRALSKDSLVAFIEGALQVPVSIVSQGPTAEDKFGGPTEDPGRYTFL